MNDSEKIADQQEVQSVGGIFAIGTIVDTRFRIIELSSKA